MYKKSKLARLTVLFAFLFVTLFSNLTTVPIQAYTDVSNMSDQTFFGAWNGSAWTTVGKLDYAVTGLSAVQTDVKAGNYPRAKADLLTYYRNRTTRTMPAMDGATSLQQLAATLEADDFVFSGVEYPLGIAAFSTTDSTVATTVTDGVNGALSQTGQVCFLLMGRDQSNNSAQLLGREAESNQPYLVINFLGGGQQIVYPTKDAFIRAGSYGNTAYGTSGELVVKESGAASSYTRRSYVMFDLSSLGVSSIASATLQLYGHGTNGTYNVVVINSGNVGFDESTITWNNTTGYTYSWTGISGGTDWNNPPYAQSQFDTAMHRFWLFKNLEPAYVAAPSEYYAGNMIRIWLDYINDKGNSNPINLNSLDTGIRSDYLVNAYHLIKNSTSLDAAANTAMLKYFWQMGNALASTANYHPQNNNWAVFESQGLYDIALYFPEFTSASMSGGWMETSKTRLTNMISSLVRADGSYVEATTGYAAGVAESYSYIKLIGAVNNDYFPDLFDMKLQQLGRYVMDFSRPDGKEAGFGDSDAEGDVTRHVLAVAEKYPARTDLLYFGSNRTQGEVPSNTSSVYPEGKAAFMKTGYNINDMFMSIDMNGGGHSHPDLNSVTAYAYGRNLLVDPGVCSYDSDTISNWYRLTTQAHNTVEIDNKAQSMSGSVTKVLDDFSTNNLFDFYEGDHNGYVGLDHMRDVMFIRGGYWIVSDYIAPDVTTTSHTYNQTWHLLPNSYVSLNGTTKRATSAFSSGANIQIVPVDPSSVTATIQSGYYAPYGGSNYTADYVSYVKTGSGNKTFDTVLFPTQEADTNRNVTVTRLTTIPSVATDAATSFKVSLNYGNNGNIGYYYLNHDYYDTTATRGFDTYSYNGKAVYVETDYQNNYKLAAVKKGTRLTGGGVDLILSPAMINDMGVKWNGTTLDISGLQLIPDTSTSTAVEIYAPSATTVTLNGVAVPFTRIGNYIYAAKTVNGVTPCDDAYVRNGTYANTNYAVDSTMCVKSGTTGIDRRSYMMFDLNKYTNAQGVINVNSAKIRLNTYGVDTDATRTIKIYGSNENWSENIITYNNAPPGLTYITSITITSSDVNKWFEADVTSYVKNHGDRYVDFYLVNEGAATAHNGVDFYTKDSGTNKPIMVIN